MRTACGPAIKSDTYITMLAEKPSFDIWPASNNNYDMQLLQWPRSWCQRCLQRN
jgi:hypothetical protein